LNKQKAKIQRKNKEYRRQLSELSGPSGHQNKSGYIGETKLKGERSFLETSGIINQSLNKSLPDGNEQSMAVKWKHLSIKEKIKLFNPWCIGIMFANVFQLVGATSVLFSHSITLSFNELLIGLGCFGAWIGILRFIDTDTKLYSAPRTIKTAFPIIFRILVGVTPIFIGFSFLGMCLFWRSDKFKSPSDTFFSLFAMMYGDAIRDIYTDVSFGKHLAANLYCYSFVFFAICVVQNIFIIVMQESYFTARKYNLEEDLFGVHKEVEERESTKSVAAVEARPKTTKSKQTLMKILEEDRYSMESSNKLPRSKSGFIDHCYPHITSLPEKERQLSTNQTNNITTKSKEIMRLINELKTHAQQEIKSNPSNKKEIKKNFDDAIKKIKDKITQS